MPCYSYTLYFTYRRQKYWLLFLSFSTKRKPIFRSSYTYPSMSPQIQSSLSMRCEVTIQVRASTVHGIKANRITTHDILFRALGSKPNPALVRITANATFLQTKKYCLSFNYSVSPLAVRKRKKLPNSTDPILNLNYHGY